MNRDPMQDASSVRSRIRRIAGDDRLDDETALEAIRELIRRPVRITAGERASQTRPQRRQSGQKT